MNKIVKIVLARLDISNATAYVGGYCLCMLGKLLVVVVFFNLFFQVVGI